MTRVKLIYRNYKPLHKIYESLVVNPPEGIEYVVPRPVTRLKKFYPLSKSLRHFTLTRQLIHLVEKRFFLDKNNDSIHILHFINMMDSRIPDRPYIVDLEHAASLIGFVKDEKKLNEAKRFLLDANCKNINCLSRAAKRTLKEFMGDDYYRISSKVGVVYPAAESVSSSIKPDYKYINKNNNKLKVLFVGNQAYLKGLEEILIALSSLNKKNGDKNIQLYVIANDASPLLKKYGLPNVKLFAPNFSREQIVAQFFLTADVFIMPTKEDTFGMAILDSLVCGTPVIATDQFALPELITPQKDGILIHTKEPLLDNVLFPSKNDMKRINHSNIDVDIVSQIISIFDDFINNKDKLKKLKSNGKNKFKPGNQFSIDKRNTKLRKIYLNALK